VAAGAGALSGPDKDLLLRNIDSLKEVRAGGRAGGRPLLGQLAACAEAARTCPALPSFLAEPKSAAAVLLSARHPLRRARRQSTCAASAAA
jgi:hypothetical protein